MTMLTRLQALSSILKVIAHQADPHPIWIVGGTVRDILSDRDMQDIDLVIDGAAIPLARQVADSLGGSFVLLDAEREIARVVINPQLYIDIARMRGATIQADLGARDLTINAIAISLNATGKPDEIIDPFGGQKDIEAQRLSACSETIFKDDPLRLLRVARFAAMFGWQIDDTLHEQIKAHAQLITNVAMERVQQELIAILNQRWSAPILRYLQQVGILFRLIPELEATYHHDQPGHVFPVWEHLLEAVCCGDWLIAELFHTQENRPPTLPAEPNESWPPAFFNCPSAVHVHPTMKFELQWQERVRQHMQQPIGMIPRSALWKLAILLHDIAKPTTRIDHPNGRTTFHEHQTIGADIAKVICERLKLSREAQKYIWIIIRGHMRPGQLTEQGETTRRAAYRFFRDLQPAAVETLLHSLIDHLASQAHLTSLNGWAMHQAWTDAMLGFHWDRAEETSKPIIDGHTLIKALNIQPGPHIGTLLEAIYEAHATGEIHTQEEALALARQLEAQL